MQANILENKNIENDIIYLFIMFIIRGLRSCEKMKESSNG